MEQFIVLLEKIPAAVWTGIGMALSSFFTYWATHRAQLKKEKTDDFTALMNEGNQIRDWVKSELLDTRAELARSQDRILILTKEINTNLNMITALNIKISSYEEDIRSLRQRVIDQEIIIAEYSMYKVESEKKIKHLTELVIQFGIDHSRIP